MEINKTAVMTAAMTLIETAAMLNEAPSSYVASSDENGSSVIKGRGFFLDGVGGGGVVKVRVI